jgi:hypothetical protein
VDIVNTITIGKEQFVLAVPPPLARGHMGDDFLFGKGNVYVGVIWDKTAVEAPGNGTIATAVDGYTILRDAATVARNPSVSACEAGAALHPTTSLPTVTRRRATCLGPGISIT